MARTKQTARANVGFISNLTETSGTHGQEDRSTADEDGTDAEVQPTKRARVMATTDGEAYHGGMLQSRGRLALRSRVNAMPANCSFPPCLQPQRQFSSSPLTTTPVPTLQPQQAPANTMFLATLPTRSQTDPVEYGTLTYSSSSTYSTNVKPPPFNSITLDNQNLSVEAPTADVFASGRDDRLTFGLDLIAPPITNDETPLPVFPSDIDLSDIPYQTDVETWAQEKGSHEMERSASLNTFMYPSLDDPRQNIRLLRIDSTPDSRDLRCTLISTQPWIDDRLYECLSYCWGRIDLLQQIFVKNQFDSRYEKFSVTTNLYNALQQLRHSHTDRLLWVDALCIDQSNAAERSSQVSIMKDIYDKASGVVIWLGQITTSLSASVITINAISKRFQEDTERSLDSVAGSFGLNLSLEDLERLKTYSSTTPEYAYKLVAHFFSLPYFRRIWVLQEVISRKHIMVQMGAHVLSWGSVILAALWQSCFTRTITVLTASDSRGLDAQGYLPELWLVLLHNHSVRGMSMLELVFRARDFGASDPKDTVFALLGIANDLPDSQTRPTGLQPDYTKSKIDVYTSFARDMVIISSKLDVLSLVDTFSEEKHDICAPSWMPNLDVPIATIRSLGFPPKYGASSQSEVEVNLLREFSCNSHQLRLRGFKIDQMAYVTPQPLLFTRDLRLLLGNSDAVTQLWQQFAPMVSASTGYSWETLLRRYIELLTAAGFAMPTEFLANPIGEVVPSCQVPSIMADFAAYWARMDPTFSHFDTVHREELLRQAPIGDADQFAVLAGKGCHERRFFVTSTGRMGLCPRHSIRGDVIAILHGGSVPYVLRNCGQGTWRLVGECYVDGAMFGEQMKSQHTEEEFIIL